MRSARGGKGAGILCGTPTEQPCVVCAYTNPQEFDLDVEPNEGLAKCYPRDQFAIAGWIEGKFHLVKEKGRKDPTKEYEVRKRCLGQKCKHCRDDAPVVFGNRFYIGFSRSAWTNSLFEAHTRAGQVCKCGGYVYATEYKCPHCDTVLYDAAAECDKCGGTNIGLEVEDGEGDYEAGVWAVCEDCHKTWALCVLDNETLAEEVMDEVRCPECGETDLMEPVDACTNEECDGDPYDVFDCQLVIKKESAEQTASLVVDSMKIKNPDPRLFDPEHQGPDPKEAERAVEAMKTPLDLREVYKLQSTSEQAKILGVKDPFMAGGGSGVRQYQKDEDGEDYDEDYED